MRLAALIIVIGILAVLPVASQVQTKPTTVLLRIVASKKQDAVEAAMKVLEQRMTSAEPGQGYFNGHGYIINYGTDAEILAREKQLQNTTFLQQRFYEGPMIIVVRGGFHPIASSEIWFVPPGADNPIIDSGFKLLTEIGSLDKELMMAEIDAVYIELMSSGKNASAYFLVRGPARQRTRFTRMVRSYVTMRKLDLSRLEFRDVGLSKNLKVSVYVPAN